MSKEQKVITWLDADTHLCRVAAFMLDQAGKYLRGPWPMNPISTTNGERITNGFGTDDKKQGIWSIAGDPHVPRFIPGTNEPEFSDNVPSPICWWSFQNIVRQRLRQARQELKEALYEQNRGLKASRNKTRNPDGRKRGSKFGWKDDG